MTLKQKALETLLTAKEQLLLAGYAPASAAVLWLDKTIATVNDAVLVDQIHKDTKVFRVVARSSKVNRFGLRNWVFVARDGEAWSAAHSIGGGATYTMRVGDDITFSIDKDGRPCFENAAYELATRLPAPTEASLKEMFGE